MLRLVHRYIGADVDAKKRADESARAEGKHRDEIDARATSVFGRLARRQLSVCVCVARAHTQQANKQTHSSRLDGRKNRATGTRPQDRRFGAASMPRSFGLKTLRLVTVELFQPISGHFWATLTSWLVCSRCAPATGRVVVRAALEVVE